MTRAVFTGRRLPGWARRAVLLADGLARWWRGIDRPEAFTGGLFCVEARRAPRDVRLADGTLIRRGDPIGVIHCDNPRVWKLYSDSASRHACAFAVFGRMDESLVGLARQGDLRAFSATTVFHRYLGRFGFRPESSGGPAGVVMTLGCELLRAVEPGSSGRAPRQAERVWITRDELLRRYPARI